ncbi:MAG: EAL domain-containing protein [Butyrivibrio sp.]|jgi:EAL domain-containing protein (putative c-di-GMP-specific phosphodiesterase class I)/GGDEF domain-containing protein|nr:EAL domain-containing protein [Butyrivibrio sp.]
MAMYNFYFDICAICILSTIAIMTLFRKWVPTYQNHAFLVLFFAIAMTVLSERVETLLQMNPQPGMLYHYAEKAAGSSYFTFHLLSAAFYLIYVLAVMNIPVSIRHDFFPVFFAFFAGMALIVFNWFNPVMFYYDETGLYHRAPFMLLFYLFGCHYVLGGLITLYRHRRRLQNRMVNIMVSYILLIIFGMVVQAAFSKMLVEGFFSSISLLLTYITIQSPSEMIDEEVEVLNRRAFLASASMQMDRKKPFITIYLGVDHVLAMSQALGDIQLRNLMKMMADSLKIYRKDMFLYRYTDNTYAMMMRRPDAEVAQQIMQELVERFSKPWKFKNNSIHVDFYLWMLEYPKQYGSIDDLVNRNEMIMKPENRRGQVIVQVDQIDFMGDINLRNFISLSMKAVQDGSAEVRYIPVYHLDEQKFRALEAVCFFPASDGEWLNGHDFITSTDHSRALAEVDMYVLEKVCRFLHGHPSVREAVYGVSMKISLMKFLSQNFEACADEMLKKYEIDPAKIYFKLSETSFSNMPEDGIKKMQRLEKKGYHFLIDDVGIGFSDMYHLINAQAVSVNLNSSLIRVASESVRAGAMVRDLVEMIHDSHQQIGAEGVDTAWQAEVLKTLACDYAQGDFYSRPLKEEQLMTFLQEH